MTTTMDNLEKLIQMATIEHMYAMLKKMKDDSENNKGQECNCSVERSSAIKDTLTRGLLNEINTILLCSPNIVGM